MIRDSTKLAYGCDEGCIASVAIGGVGQAPLHGKRFKIRNCYPNLNLNTYLSFTDAQQRMRMIYNQQDAMPILFEKVIVNGQVVPHTYTMKNTFNEGHGSKYIHTRSEPDDSYWLYATCPNKEQAMHVRIWKTNTNYDGSYIGEQYLMQDVTPSRQDQCWVNYANAGRWLRAIYGIDDPMTFRLEDVADDNPVVQQLERSFNFDDDDDDYYDVDGLEREWDHSSGY